MTTTSSTGLSKLIGTALVFSAGVLLSNHVKHFISSRDTDAPPVSVAYSTEGTYIDGQRYTNGRLGAPRCDWDSLSLSDRRDYAIDALGRDPATFSTYVRSIPADQKQFVVYSTLIQLARERGTTPGKQAEDIARNVGWRWNIVYSPTQPE
jgi:hypothetical protein